MTKITLAEANEIASKYFKLLIDRHIAQGFSAEIVERKEDESNSNYYLVFCNEEKTKSYKILACNN